MIPSNVGTYRIVREIGSGAMGSVYEAVDTVVERRVAIKMLRAEIARQPELVSRFRSEAVTQGRLSHPNIAMLHTFFREGDDYYIVMEFVSGQSLESIIQRSKGLELPTSIRIMEQILDGLYHAHCAGILHRDIKPSNILVTADERVKLTDFGIARLLGSSRMTRTGHIIGTLEYMAPERIKGDESDLRSDLYSAGIVLYEMVTGKLPFTGSSDYDLIKAQVEDPIPTLREALARPVPAEWESVVRRALAKAPGERFQDARAFRDALPQAETAEPESRALKPMRATPGPNMVSETGSSCAPKPQASLQSV